MITVQKVDSNVLLDDPDFYILAVEYEDESSNKELGPCNWNRKQYLEMEERGVFHIVAAHDNGKLVGLATAVVAVLPHYSVPVATVESIFVRPEYRKGRVGLHLIDKIESVAKDGGAMGLFLTAPVGSSLAGIAPRKGYRHTNEVFFKSLHE